MPLPEMSMDDLILDREQAIEILEFLLLVENVSFFAEDLNERDCLFAQQLAAHAVDLHYSMGFIESLVSSMSKLPKGPSAVFKDFAKRAASHWFKHATHDDLEEFVENPQLYVSIRNMIAARYRTIWTIREDQGIPPPRR